MNSKLLLTLLIIILGVQRNYAQCPNGNAEQGTFNLWGTKTGFFTTDIKNFTSPSSRVSVIQNTGTFNDATLTNNIDKYGGFKVPNEGTYAFRLGDDQIISSSTGLSEIIFRGSHLVSYL